MWVLPVDVAGLALVALAHVDTVAPAAASSAARARVDLDRRIGVAHGPLSIRHAPGAPSAQA